MKISFWLCLIATNVSGFWFKRSANNPKGSAALNAISWAKDAAKQANVAHAHILPNMAADAKPGTAETVSDVATGNSSDKTSKNFGVTVIKGTLPGTIYYDTKKVSSTAAGFSGAIRDTAKMIDSIKSSKDNKGLKDSLNNGIAAIDKSIAERKKKGAPTPGSTHEKALKDEEDLKKSMNDCLNRRSWVADRLFRRAPACAWKPKSPIAANQNKPIIAAKNAVAKPAIAAKNGVTKPAIAAKNMVAKPTIAAKNVVTKPTIAVKNGVAKPIIAAKNGVAKPTITAKNGVTKPAIAAKNVVAKPIIAAKKAVAKPIIAAKKAVAKPIMIVKRALTKPIVAPKKVVAKAGSTKNK